ncbi:Alpha/beta hydrolase family [Carpediemonas membranifera]|uniref:Alpha/beta hydrolase family n=1 Tax=Carpediemonas membranifera TaxID=201153 RepID=A0A8J6E3W1_9EUKA|nr:Alpha/beta hydrolase family [Carpediemonas membranifera]|eukprot:KAG9393697.1 Alpha/beta hydrolase family [Carpediemonas membranifera]
MPWPIPNYVSNKQGLRIRIDSYYPKNYARVAHAVVLFLHGMGEYGSRYAHVFEAFVAAGYIVIAPTYAGHGLSEGPRAVIEDFESLLGDLVRVSDLIDSYFTLPRFIMGTSMGSAIAVMLASEFPASWRHGGVILSSPLFGFADGLKFPGFNWALRLGAMVAPGWVPHRVKASNLTCHPRFLAAEEPLLGKGTPLRTLASMLTMLDVLPTLKHKCIFPTLLLLAQDDRVVDNKLAEDYVAAIPSEDKVVTTARGKLHELLHDTEWEDSVRIVVQWMDETVE